MPVTDEAAGTKTEKEQEQERAVELLIGVTGDVNPVDLRRRVAEALAESSLPMRADGEVVVSWPGSDGSGVEPGKETLPTLIPYRPVATSESGPWAQISSAQRGILALATELKAGACMLLSADMMALQAGAACELVAPILDRQCDVAIPIYTQNRFDGLVNTAILMPLTRALYCKRVQMPMPLDFAVSSRYAERIAAKNSHGLLWPAIAAAQETMQIGQVHLPSHHHTPMEGLDLTAVLTQIVGSLFLEIEHTAATWQRGRSAQPTPVWGQPARMKEAEDAIEVRPMVESFQLGSRNLDELWQLVLPPVTLLELRHLAKKTVEEFRIPDRLWARIVYDFALAHRLRPISRGHLMGALTPLYLGWVASYVQEVTKMTADQVERRQEQLARAFEESKPYLVSRWRWPDRFNP